MRFEIIGGDERSRQLALLLAGEGHEVGCFALDKAELPEYVRRLQRPEGADCVILPLPAETGRLGTLNAPFSAISYSAGRLLSALGEGSIVCAGKISPRLRAAASESGVRLFDYMARPEFTVGNAAVTAEGAVSLCMSSTGGTVSGSRALVIGWGRVGKLSALKLSALGAEVTVLSRSSESRAMAEAMGLRAVSPQRAAELLPRFDMLVNTAPARVLPDEALALIRHGCFVLELASAPGGIDAEAAEKYGLNYLAAPGLPGKYAPLASAQLIRGAVMNIIEECAGND